MKRTVSILLIILLVSPSVYLLIKSLSVQQMFPELAPSLTSEHWTDVLVGKSGFWRILLQSVLLSFTISVSTTSVASFLARYLFYPTQSKVWRYLVLLPFMVTPILFAISLQYYFLYIGIAGTVFGVFLAQFLYILPYAIFLQGTIWTERQYQYLDLLSSLGAKERQKWTMFIWPNYKNSLYIISFQCFLVSWFDFGWVQYIGMGRVKTLTLEVYSLIMGADIGTAAVVSGVLLVPPLMIYIGINRRGNQIYSIK